MNIVIGGGTGFIGKALCESLHRSGHQLTVLTRRPIVVDRLFGSKVKAVEWDGRSPGAWERSLREAQVVINLAGAGIADGRWTDSRKRVLVESRILSTELLVQACARLGPRPEVFINASGIGFYGPHGDEVLVESSGQGHGFLANLCAQWESDAQKASTLGIRVVCVRTGMVLGRDGGALPRMALPFRLFVGGPVSPGTQWVSWVHQDDVIGLIEWAMSSPAVNGPLNAVAPSPVRMTEFCRTLGNVLHRPSWLPVPQWVLNAALGELGSIMTTGQRVAPGVAQGNGYRFAYPFLHGALKAIYAGK